MDFQWFPYPKLFPPGGFSRFLCSDPRCQRGWGISLPVSWEFLKEMWGKSGLSCFFLSFQTYWTIIFQDEFGFCCGDDVFWSPTPSQQNILREGYRMIDHDWPVDFIKRKGFEHDDGYGFSSIQIYLPYQICFQCFSWLTTDSYCWCFKQDPVHHHYFWIVLICIYYNYVYLQLYTSIIIHPSICVNWIS